MLPEARTRCCDIGRCRLHVGRCRTHPTSAPTSADVVKHRSRCCHNVVCNIGRCRPMSRPHQPTSADVARCQTRCCDIGQCRFNVGRCCTHLTSAPTSADVLQHPGRCCHTSASNIDRCRPMWLHVVPDVVKTSPRHRPISAPCHHPNRKIETQEGKQKNNRNTCTRKKTH